MRVPDPHFIEGSNEGQVCRVVDLLRRHVHCKRSYDPVDYESIDKTEFWVVEEEQDGKLDYDELEEELEELPIDNSNALATSQHDDIGDGDDDKIAEEVNVELFQRRGLIGGNEDDDDWLNSDGDDDWPNLSYVFFWTFWSFGFGEMVGVV